MLLMSSAKNNSADREGEKERERERETEREREREGGKEIERVRDVDCVSSPRSVPFLC